MAFAFRRFLALDTGLNPMKTIDIAKCNLIAAQMALLASCCFCGTALAQPAAPQVIAATDKEVVGYTLKSGESLFTVGDRYFSSRGDYEHVRAYNRIKNPRSLPPGTVISVPRRYLKTRQLEAQILAFRGNATVEQAGVAAKPVIGAKVSEGMILQTAEDGFMTLGLSNGSRITIPSKSRIRVAQMREVLLTGSVDFDFTLDQGRAEATVSPLKNKDDRFRLRTPIAVSAVRGTKFRVAYDSPEKPSLTEVTEGGVRVSVAAVKMPAEPPVVPAGFGATASASGAIGTEALLAAPAVLNPGRLQKDANVQITVAPVASATGYHVQLAQDAGFIDMLAAKRSDTPTAAFENIPDGSYFVRAMAIAPSGLEGMSETYSLRRVLTVVGGAAAALEPGVFQFKWLGQGEGKRSFRFQLLRDPKDTVALVDEVGLADTSIVLKGLAPGTYFWRVAVRQFSSAGVSESWTSPEKVIVSAVEK
jgi:hypothetical protein